ncbi:hypothetical protein [Carnimonas bestiolae]|uniref:hypothetical protein n=1 Tax=Carnimonas bestiolae TaxID=3402172 RepID=UPI003EDBDCB0
MKNEGVTFEYAVMHALRALREGLLTVDGFDSEAADRRLKSVYDSLSDKEYADENIVGVITAAMGHEPPDR